MATTKKRYNDTAIHGAGAMQTFQEGVHFRPYEVKYICQCKDTKGQ